MQVTYIPPFSAGGSSDYPLVEGFESDGGGGVGDGYYEAAGGADLLNVENYILLLMVRHRYIQNNISQRFAYAGSSTLGGSDGGGLQCLTGFSGGESSIRAAGVGSAGTVQNADSVISKGVTIGRWLCLAQRRENVAGAMVNSLFINGHLSAEGTVAGEGGARATGVFTLGAPRGGGNGALDAPQGMLDFVGGGLIFGTMTNQQIGRWATACLGLGNVADVPDGPALNHRWLAADFADPWVDTEGGVNLVRVGTSPNLQQVTESRQVI